MRTDHSEVLCSVITIIFIIRCLTLLYIWNQWQWNILCKSFVLICSWNMFVYLQLRKTDCAKNTGGVPMMPRGWD